MTSIGAGSLIRPGRMWARASRSCGSATRDVPLVEDVRYDAGYDARYEMPAAKLVRAATIQEANP